MSTTSSVTTNTNDYAPGSYAIITATGFAAGSSVTFEVDHVSDPGADGALARIVSKLPDAQTLDRIAYRTAIFAFPVFGFGVMTCTPCERNSPRRLSQ